MYADQSLVMHIAQETSDKNLFGILLWYHVRSFLPKNAKREGKPYPTNIYFYLSMSRFIHKNARYCGESC
jgi:hypothetical protein